MDIVYIIFFFGAIFEKKKTLFFGAKYTLILFYGHLKIPMSGE